MTEQELLVVCLTKLNESEIAYMLTGSMASNYWGVPRSTHDLDFVIQLPISAIPRLVATFSTDFHIDESAVRAAYRPPFQFNAIHVSSGLKVDFWLPANIPFEREMFRRRQKRELFGNSAWIGSPEDIILHKLYWDRVSPSDRQQRDAAGVFAIQRDALDFQYMRQYAAELDVSGALDLILEGKLKPKLT